jgi:hypothetical protein
LASIDTVLRFYSTGNNPERWGSSATGHLLELGPQGSLTGVIRPRGTVPIAAAPRLPAHPLIHLAERERHGDRMSQNPGNAWPSRLHLPVDVNGPATGSNSCGRRGSVSMIWRGKATAQCVGIGIALLENSAVENWMQIYRAAVARTEPERLSDCSAVLPQWL